MNRNLTIAAIAMFAVIMGMSAFAPAMADKPGTVNEDKVELCHVPPGSPDNPRTISVSEDDAQVHFDDHDLDFPGPCED